MIPIKAEIQQININAKTGLIDINMPTDTKINRMKYVNSLNIVAINFGVSLKASFNLAFKLPDKLF